MSSKRHKYSTCLCLRTSAPAWQEVQYLQPWLVRGWLNLTGLDTTYHLTDVALAAIAFKATMCGYTHLCIDLNVHSCINRLCLGISHASSVIRRQRDFTLVLRGTLWQRSLQSNSLCLA